MFKKRFKVTDNGLNSYGYRVLTEGIDLTDFLENPIGLWNHNRATGGLKDEILPICKWEDVEIVGDEIFATAVFSELPHAKDIAQLVEEGILVAASIGVRMLEFSDDPEFLVEGQTVQTVTKSSLREISITDIPSNKRSIALYDGDGNITTLSDGGANSPLPLSLKIETMKKEVLDILNLKEGDESVVIAAIKKLQAENLRLEAQLNDQHADGIKNLLDAAVADKRLSETQRPIYQRIFDLDLETGKKALEGLTPALKLSDIPVTTKGAKGKVLHNGMTFMQLREQEPEALSELKSTNFDFFKQLYKSDLGVEWAN